MLQIHEVAHAAFVEHVVPPAVIVDRNIDELGIALDIDGSSGEAVAARDWYYYHPDFGLVARGPLVDPARPAFHGADLLAIAANDFGGTARLTAKRLLRQVLAQQLGDAPLRSRELFRVQAGSGREPESTIPEPP